MDTQIRIWKIDELENLKLDYYLIMEKKIKEAYERGESAEFVFMDLPGMKERYLEALEAYGSLGLTSEELLKKRLIWLWRPGEDYFVANRFKTVSMFLHRLKHAGLADRVREDRAYRYFITMNGRNRLQYYRDQKRPLG